MDQRINGTGPAPERPIHRACVVAGCWCTSTTAAIARSARPSVARPSVARPIRAADLTNIAWRSVGLPVV